MKIHDSKAGGLQEGRSHGKRRAGMVLSLILGGGLAGLMPVRAQGPMIEITGIEVGPGQVAVQFRDTGTASTAYRLEHAASMTPPVTWTSMATAVITAVGGGEYRGSVTRPEGALGFLRVLGSLSGGGEVASAAFEPGTLETREGGGSGPRLVFSKPYTGTLRYVYTGAGMVDSGEVLLAGASEVTLPAPKVADDEIVDGLRTFSLRLERVGGGDVVLGEVASVVTEDNDEVWRGMLGAEGTVVFNLVVTRTGAGSRAVLRGDATSFFPTGDFSAAVLEFTTSRLRVRVPGIALTETGAPFEGVVVNELELEADAPAGTGSWVGNTISGRYTWRTSVENRAHLNTTESGEFHMKRQPSAAPTSKLPLTEVQP